MEWFIWVKASIGGFIGLWGCPTSHRFWRLVSPFRTASSPKRFPMGHFSMIGVRASSMRAAGNRRAMCTCQAAVLRLSPKPTKGCCGASTAAFSWRLASMCRFGPTRVLFCIVWWAPKGLRRCSEPAFRWTSTLHGSSGRGHRRPASRARRQRVPRVGVPSVFARVYRRGASGWKRRRREGMARPSVLVCQRSCFEVASCFYAKSGGFQPFGRISCLCPFGCALFRRTGDRNGSRYWNCEPCVLQGVLRVRRF